MMAHRDIKLVIGNKNYSSWSMRPWVLLREAGIPMNIRSSFPGKGMSPEVQRDIDHIVALWQSCRERHAAQGGMLFGRFSIADAYYAPVVMRFMTHAVALPPQAQAYADAVRALPSVREWMAAARSETAFVAADEPYASW